MRGGFSESVGAFARDSDVSQTYIINDTDKSYQTVPRSKPRKLLKKPLYSLEALENLTNCLNMMPSI